MLQNRFFFLTFKDYLNKGGWRVPKTPIGTKKVNKNFIKANSTFMAPCPTFTENKTPLEFQLLFYQWLWSFQLFLSIFIFFFFDLSICLSIQFEFSSFFSVFEDFEKKRRNEQKTSSNPFICRTKNNYVNKNYFPFKTNIVLGFI